MGNRRYLVSPQDLCGLRDIPRLVEMGIESFKIEGRLKSPEYVASSARAYKERSLGALRDGAVSEHERSLGRIYSRGFFNGWFDGVNHQRLVDPTKSSHHGIPLGSVVRVDSGAVVVESSEPVVAGDGVVFTGLPHTPSTGATVFQAKREGRYWRLSFDRAFSLASITSGAAVYLNSSPHLEAEVRSSFCDKQQLKRIPLRMTVTGAVGTPLTVTAIDLDGNMVSAASSAALESASRSPLSYESARAELGALSGTVYTLENLSLELTGAPCFIHNRELKEIRRALCAELNRLRITRSSLKTLTPAATGEWLKQNKPMRAQPTLPPQLNVLVREFEQLEGLRGLPVHTVYLDFEFGKEYGPASEVIRSMGFEVGIATTRILKPGETAHLKVIERLKPDAVLVRNLGALHYLRDKGLNLVGDFSLNISNSLSAQWFDSKGLSRLSPSYDLNSEQLLDLVRSCAPSKLEVTAHHYIPAFHMEHCVFAAFLSSGTSYRDCGRPCEKHRVQLRDTKGALHPLKADAECRNTMFNGAPQSAATLIPQLIHLGVSVFRLEGLFEDAQTLRRKVEAYAALLRGEITPEALIASLGTEEKFGVTNGQLYNIRGYRDRKKEFTALAQLPQTADPGLQLIRDGAAPAV
jgi:putative protease